jgi:hypothetical protein
VWQRLLCTCSEACQQLLTALHGAASITIQVLGGQQGVLQLQAGNVDSRYIDPFRLGLSCLGGITLFLAGLIRCSLYYDQWGSSRDRCGVATHSVR